MENNETQDANEEQQKIIDEIVAEEGGQKEEVKVNEGEESEETKSEGENQEGDKSDDDGLSHLDEEVDKLIPKEEEKKEEKIGDQPVPLAKHLKQLHNRDEKISELEAELAKVKQGKNETDPEYSERVSALAEKIGVDSESLTELLALAKNDASAEFNNKLKSIEPLILSVQQEKETQVFNKEFETKLLDLVKEEHGAENVDKVKKSLERLAFTSAYAKVPLEMIYKGLDLFRAKKAPKTSPEGSGGGGNNITKVVDFSKITEDDIDGMDEKTFEAYGKWLRKNG